MAKMLAFLAIFQFNSPTSLAHSVNLATFPKPSSPLHCHQSPVQFNSFPFLTHKKHKLYYYCCRGLRWKEKSSPPLLCLLGDRRPYSRIEVDDQKKREEMHLGMHRQKWAKHKRGAEFSPPETPKTHRNCAVEWNKMEQMWRWCHKIGHTNKNTLPPVPFKKLCLLPPKKLAVSECLLLFVEFFTNYIFMEWIIFFVVVVMIREQQERKLEWKLWKKGNGKKRIKCPIGPKGEGIAHVEWRHIAYSRRKCEINLPEN